MVADTYSNTLGYLVMGTGNDNNTWGNNANTAVFQIFEDAIANALSSGVTGGTLDFSGSPPPAAASQARYAALIFTGVLGSDQVVQVPNLTKFWWVKNSTSGAFALKFQTPAAVLSTAIPQNSGWQLVYCDGTNGIVVMPFNSVQVQMPNGSASAPAYSYINETNSGWYRNGTQDHRLSINGVDVLQATGAGAGTPSVINVLTPNRLQVNGVDVGINWVAAGGSADAITATYAPAISALTDGLLCFVRASAANATTTPTFAPNGLTAHTITKSGGQALIPNDIPGANAELILRYRLASTTWELLNPAQFITTSPPQGRLTLVSGTPVMTGDATAQSTVYYTPCVGNLIPIWNGTAFLPTSFAELSMVMSGANFAANAIYDLFVASDSGTLRLGIGPVWGTLTAGSGARGAGAGTTELERKNGIWTNKNSMTVRYASGSTFTAAANQATYVGSIFMDGTNSQVSCYLSVGQSRKYGLWNAYNRVPIVLRVTDSTASWTYNSATIRQSRATAANTLALFCGLAEEEIDTEFSQQIFLTGGGGTIGAVYIGLNSTTVASGTRGVRNDNLPGGTNVGSTVCAKYTVLPFIGVNNINALESGNSAPQPTFNGTELDMLLRALWRG